MGVQLPTKLVVSESRISGCHQQYSPQKRTWNLKMMGPLKFGSFAGIERTWKSQVFKPAVKKTAFNGRGWYFCWENQGGLGLGLTLPGRGGPPEYIVLPLIWSTSWSLPVNFHVILHPPKIDEQLREASNVHPQNVKKTHLLCGFLLVFCDFTSTFFFKTGQLRSH